MYQPFVTKFSWNGPNELNKTIAKRNSQSTNDLVCLLELMMIADEGKNPMLTDNFVTMFLLSTSNFIRSPKYLQFVIKSRFHYFLQNMFKQIQYIITQTRQEWLISCWNFKNVCSIHTRIEKKGSLPIVLPQTIGGSKYKVGSKSSSSIKCPSITFWLIYSIRPMN